jgi:signal transduction histidine kinase
VVDDDASNLVAIEAALGELADQVVRAQSGAEALRLLLDRDFALILLDVNMPSMDGFETARAIRSRKRSRHTPIIFVTAHDRSEREVLAAYGLGAVDFLFKPVFPEVLRAKATVFVDLHLRNLEVARQAELLREHERRSWEEEALRRKMEELAEADRRKDEFLATLGHELRNPLVPIASGLEIVRMAQSRGEGAPDPGLVRVRESMERQVRHLVRLVDDLLDIARVNSGRIELRREPITLADLVEEAVAAVQPFLEPRGHTLSIGLPATSVFVEVDPVRLTQVLTNLLHNAGRFSEPGQPIRLTAASREGWVDLAISDQGRGIEPAALDRVFDLFFQQRLGGEGGLGLGLTLVKRLVEMHGGTVRVESPGAGQGSRFTVSLPTCRPPAEVVVPAPVPTVTAARCLTVAVVEDNEDVRETMQELLIHLGHKVEVAPDGHTGAELILAVRPDVALVDIGLPKLDGYELARRVRTALAGKPLRLVAMTGFGQDTDRRRALEAGFDAHLIKPASIEDITEVLSDE